MNRIQKARLKLNQKLETHEADIPCFYQDPNLFDPEMYDDYRTRMRTIELAKSYCAICPAKQECYDYGYKSSATAMIWGGATIQEINHAKYRQK
jgi:lipoate synthase